VNPFTELVLPTQIRGKVDKFRIARARLWSRSDLTIPHISIQLWPPRNSTGKCLPGALLVPLLASEPPVTRYHDKTYWYIHVFWQLRPCNCMLRRLAFKLKADNSPTLLRFAGASYIIKPRSYKVSRYKSEALRLWPQRCNAAKPTQCCNSFPQVQGCNCGSGCSFYRTLSR
jgi:hypothetical protein